MLLEGVYPFIYSPVECTCAVGSNRLNQGPRCIKRGGGGSFRKGEQSLTTGGRAGQGGTGWPHLVAFAGPVASGFFWSVPDPVGGVVASRISFVFILHLNPSFQLSVKPIIAHNSSQPPCLLLYCAQPSQLGRHNSHLASTMGVAMSPRAVAWLLAHFLVLALIVSGAPHEMSTASSQRRRALAEAGPLGCCSGGRVAGSPLRGCPRMCPPPRG